jgi:2-dehydro-3-deoxyphosphogluconate aldolase/(4S)-4-hydroxy-2-oxoglutarate aldolase
MTREDVRTRILSVGIVPAIRTDSAEDALFAAGAIFRSGITVLELTMTVPDSVDVLSELRRMHPDAVVGAGTVLDIDIARRCLDAGAAFLTSPGLEPSVIAFAEERGVAVIPGALTPTEVLRAIKARADFIKIFPCAQFGGPAYIRALKAPFPNARLIASGGVNQGTAMDYLNAGACVLGIRAELIPLQAIKARNEGWIHELAGRFLEIVKHSRKGAAQ